MKNLTVQKGDVLVSIAGTVGRASVYEKDKKSVISQSIARIRLDEKIALNKYVSLFLNSKIGKDIFLKYRHDVGQPNINTEELKELPIILPKDIQTQQKIVDKVYPLLIESKNLEKGMNIDTIYNELSNKIIGDKYNINNISLSFKTGEESTYSSFKFINEIENRLDSISNHPKQNLIKELSNVKECVALSTICESKPRKGLSPIFDKKGTYDLIKTTDMKNLYIDYKKSLKVNSLFCKEKSEYLLSKNNIIISATGFASMGKIDIVTKNNVFISGELVSFRIDESRYNPLFVVYYLRSILGQVQIDKYWTGSSGQIHLSARDISKIIIPSSLAIPIKEQNKIVKNITKKLDEYINSETKKKELKIKAYQIFKEEIFNK